MSPSARPVGPHPVEIFKSEAGGAAGDCILQLHACDRHSWLVHLPFWLLVGYLVGSVEDALLNVVYNWADSENKVAFVLACWSAAESESQGRGEALLG